MTRLILDTRLPDEFHPADGNELLRGLAALWPKLLPYVERDDDLRRRQMSTIMLCVSSLLAIAISFVDPKLGVMGAAAQLCRAVAAQDVVSRDARELNPSQACADYDTRWSH